MAGDQPASGRRPVLLAGLVALLLLPAPVAHGAAPDVHPPAADTPREPAGGEAADTAALESLLLDLARQAIPHDYEDTRRWGNTREVVRGLHVRREGLQLKTNRRRKEVNHGTWKRYHVWLADPQHGLQIDIERLEQASDGSIAFDFSAQAALGVFARLSQWERGVQLVSLSAHADAVVRLTVRSRLALELDVARLPPDVALVPQVSSARLELVDFRLRRISELRGPLVRQLGDAVRGSIRDELASREDALAERLNQQLARRQDRLRLSLADWLDGWTAAITSGAAPAATQDAPAEAPSK